MMTTVKTTALIERHRELGAKMVEFCGWEMPIQYTGVIEEHLAVRNAVGIFDVSHMGRVLVQGPQAEAYLDYLSCNKIEGKADGSATYTVWANEDGGSIDDCIVYRRNSEDFFVVVNAGNREKDFEHMQRVAADFDVNLEPRYETDGILAIQGPKALGILTEIFPSLTELKFMHL